MLESQLIHQILPTLPSASTMKSSVPDSKMMFQSCKRNVNTPPQSTGGASALRPKKLGWGSISSSLLEVPKHTWLMMIRESWMAIVPGFYLRISFLHSSRWTSSLSWQLKRQFKTSWPTHLSPSHPVLVTILVILLILYVCVYIYIYVCTRHDMTVSLSSKPEAGSPLYLQPTLACLPQLSGIGAVLAKNTADPRLKWGCLKSPIWRQIQIKAPFPSNRWPQLEAYVQIARRSGHDLSAKTTSLWGFNIPSLEESIGGSLGGGSLQAGTKCLLRYTSSLYRSEADWIIWNGPLPCHLWRCSCWSRHWGGCTSWKMPDTNVFHTEEWQKM